MPSIALYQPDIPQNTGALLRLAACMDVAVHIIEPCGFVLSDTRLKRAGMDYVDWSRIHRWPEYDTFLAACPGRVLALSTRAAHPYHAFTFASDDCLLLGRESAGLPGPVMDSVSARLTIPMAGGTRSLNMATAASMVLGEVLRQTCWSQIE